MLIGTGIGLGAIGLGFGWWYFFGKKENSESTEDIEREITEKQTGIPNIKENTQPRYVLPRVVQQKAQEEKFPIKYGDNGPHVKKLQEGLIRLYGRSILPYYGADGDFKKEMAAALQKKGIPPIIDKVTFDKIVAGQLTNPGQAPTPGKLSAKEGVDIAKNIWLNAMLHRNDGMVDQLRRIRNTEDYRMVDALMKTVGQRKSVAEVAQAAGTDDTGKQLIVAELKRIGLKYKNETWVLGGIKGPEVITHTATVIRDKRGAGIEVPAETILGEFISSTGAITSFRTIDDQLLYVPTKNIYHV